MYDRSMSLTLFRSLPTVYFTVYNNDNRQTAGLRRLRTEGGRSGPKPHQPVPGLLWWWIRPV